MTRVSIDNLGTIGVVRDRPDHTLPPEMWSAAKNIRFTDGKAVRTPGHQSVFTVAPEAFKWAMPAPAVNNYFWMLATLGKVFVFDGTTYTEITKVATTYAANDAQLWNGGLLGGVPIINNGVDDPQQWNPQTAGTKLVDLANWPAATTCQIMRPFGAYLVAMDVTKSGTRFEHMVKWSHPADPGSVPSSWDETDATKDAGENDLTDTLAGGVREAWPLGELMMIYKSGSMWEMRHVGGLFIFDFEKRFETVGILATDCAKVIPKTRQHFVATNDDVVVHDGREAVSVLDGRLRKYLANQMDPTHFDKSFVVPNIPENEMWFCFPLNGATFPNHAFIWNILDNTIAERELPSVSSGATGIVDATGTGDIWDNIAGTWDASPDKWEQPSFIRQSFDTLMTDHINSKLLLMDSTNQFDTVNIDAQLERTGLAIVGRDQAGNPRVDFEKRKLITRLWPKATGGAFDVRIGAQEVQGGAVTYGPAQTFTPGVDRYLDPVVPVSGLLMAVRMESNSNNAQWEVSGYDMRVEILGDM